MDFDYVKLLTDLGFATATAGFLVWNLSKANTKLLGQIAEMNKRLQELSTQMSQQTRLVDQNEQLINVIRQREAQSFRLVETLLAVRLESERPSKET